MKAYIKTEDMAWKYVITKWDTPRILNAMGEAEDNKKIPRNADEERASLKNARPCMLFLVLLNQMCTH